MIFAWGKTLPIALTMASATTVAEAVPLKACGATIILIESANVSTLGLVLRSGIKYKAEISH